MTKMYHRLFWLGSRVIWGMTQTLSRLFNEKNRLENIFFFYFSYKTTKSWKYLSKGCCEWGKSKRGCKTDRSSRLLRDVGKDQHRRRRRLWGRRQDRLSDRCWRDTKWIVRQLCDYLKIEWYCYPSDLCHSDQQVNKQRRDFVFAARQSHLLPALTCIKPI